ncbi:MAG: mycofactocin system FadH/OYE family oxidoreductase 1 [Acidimicrobiia bacterium]|nr:mycofactocin system FadH/OYE family oxidoreductase 1 [Acidimicrobiia bacterium]
MKLLEPLALGPRTASNRVLFGPHVTNLGDDDRRLTDRHVAYYERRASGGCGTIIVEGASVHTSDWPYERAPLADRCAEGWTDIATACHRHGSLVLASLDHAGGQGSSAYSQAPLWSPGRVPEVATREVPKLMEVDDIEAVIAGFGDAASTAVAAGLDGVEVNAGQFSLIRQFMSGLTNQRDDEWGEDRILFARRVVATVRAAIGDAGSVVVRLSCDELAPWAGITPEMAPDIAEAIAGVGADAIVVTRGSIYSAAMTRPDFHQPEGHNTDITRAVRARLDVPVVLQGSVVGWGQAEWALGGFDDPALCDGVEITRGQIADPDWVSKLAAGEADRIRPCTLCNQTCQVRDARNPIVTCVGEPSSGRETEDPDWYRPATASRSVSVIGGGPAGLETARVAALRGHDVRVFERRRRLGGMARVAGPHTALVDWYERELARLGVEVQLGVDGAREARGEGHVVQCTGSRRGEVDYEIADDATLIVDIAEVREGLAHLPAEGTIVVFDPIGGPIGVAIAEELADRAVLVTQDNIPGNELSRSGDLPTASARLAQASVTIARRTLLRAVTAAGAEVEDRYTGERRVINCVALVDCGFRLPDEPLVGVDLRAGDAVAPRTVHEAILEGRRLAADL